MPWDTISIIFAILASIVGATWHISGRLSKVETKVDSFSQRLLDLEGRILDKAFGSASPISLKPAGVSALNESGLKDWIEKNKTSLFDRCSLSGKMTNPYDIQEFVFKLFDGLDYGDFELKIKEEAYKRGWSVGIMKRIGGIYFRDLCLAQNGFKLEDLE